jgi:hypothetical protein
MVIHGLVNGTPTVAGAIVEHRLQARATFDAVYKPVRNLLRLHSLPILHQHSVSSPLDLNEQSH